MPPLHKPPPITAPKGLTLLGHAQHAFVVGLQTALTVAAGVLLAAAVVVAVLAPRRQEVQQAQNEQHRR